MSVTETSMSLKGTIFQQNSQIARKQNSRFSAPKFRLAVSNVSRHDVEGCLALPKAENLNKKF